VSSRIFFAGATLAATYSAYLDHGIASVVIVAVASVVLIVLLKRHQRQQDEQYAQLYGQHRTQPRPGQTPAPPEYGQRRT
jgi:membrane protein implicated in regulation of membrane protease activity